MDPEPRSSAPRFACRAQPPERLFIPDVHLLDPQSGVDVVGALLVDQGRIAGLGPDIQRPADAQVLPDLAGCWVFPGLVDPHVHLRTPGYEYKEDLVSGSAAAAAGGYVAVVAMANTDPVADCGPIAAWILDQAEQVAVIRIGQVGSVSRGLAGEQLSEMRELASVGVAAYSDDGRPIVDSGLLLHALRYVRGTGRPLMLHQEDVNLSPDGVMHEGRWSARLGLRGIPSACESGPLARDLEVIRYAYREQLRLEGTAAPENGAAPEDGAPPVHGAPPADGGPPADGAAGGIPLVHFQHLSSADGVHLIRRAKAEGLPVTCEATPHHLVLTDERLAGFDSNLRVNPPIRSEADRRALVAALADGTIDCVATDHAPHAPQEKEVPIEEACTGTTGLETAFAVLYSRLVITGELSLSRLIEAMSAAPCRILGIAGPRLSVGAPADFFVADLDKTWVVSPASFRGKSRNCAFLGERLTGKVRLTVVGGARRFARARGEA